jgi:3-carboxy-cis,cis-muconate cycloisomerase
MQTFSAELYGTSAMAEVFSPQAFVRAMLEFERALARAQANVGVIPQPAAHEIAAQCRAEFFDATEIFRKGVTAGTPVIPLVNALREHVMGDAKNFVHFGATSQDVIDTALVLQMRAGLRLLYTDLDAVCDACAQLADAHRHTVMAGRTLLQDAAPISFGLKAARWLNMMLRCTRELRTRANSALVLQFGGAVGTLAALDAQGIAVTDALAHELNLVAPALPWHTERDQIALLIATLGVTAGAISKIANDLMLLMAEGEISEARGEQKGASSALPQKRNPTNALWARASARLAFHAAQAIFQTMEQEHERAAGAWQSEWQIIPQGFGYTAGAVTHLKNALTGLEIDANQMRENLRRSGGLVMAEALLTMLAQRIDKTTAQILVQRAVERARAEHLSLHQTASEDKEIRAVLNADEIARALDATHSLGSSDILIDRALAAYAAETG